jgi:hypothetical protein
MKPDTAQHESQQSLSYLSSFLNAREFRPRGFQQLTVFDASRARLFARSASQAAIDVTVKGF